MLFRRNYKKQSTRISKKVRLNLEASYADDMIGGKVLGRCMLHSISQVFIFKYVSFVKTAFYVRVNNIVISSLVVLVLLSYWFARYRRDEVGSVA